MEAVAVRSLWYHFFCRWSKPCLKIPLPHVPNPKWTIWAFLFNAWADSPWDLWKLVCLVKASEACQQEGLGKCWNVAASCRHPPPQGKSSYKTGGWRPMALSCGCLFALGWVGRHLASYNAVQNTLYLQLFYSANHLWICRNSFKTSR